MEPWILHSSKYDGSLHYRYPVQLVECHEDRLITLSTPGHPLESHRGSWTTRNHLLSIFWRLEPSVLHIRWDHTWQPEYLYVDIATNTTWSAGTVRYVDMDLDLIMRSGESVPQLDDEDEFEHRRVHWNYPDHLVSRCRASVETVRQLFMHGEAPFSPSMYAWRPGQPPLP